MQRWIALFRGINVGGNNILPMAKLKSDLESLKLKNIRTYIQSGNVVFDSASKSAKGLAVKISKRIEEQHGFRPRVLLITESDLRIAVSENPFPKAVSDPKTLHFAFMEEIAESPNLKALDDAKSPTEEYSILERVFYLHAPDGIGRSKLAASAEKHLGVVTTSRNFRTVEKILALVSSG